MALGFNIFYVQTEPLSNKLSQYCGKYHVPTLFSTWTCCFKLRRNSVHEELYCECQMCNLRGHSAKNCSKMDYELKNLGIDLLCGLEEII